MPAQKRIAEHEKGRADAAEDTGPLPTGRRTGDGGLAPAHCTGNQMFARALAITAVGHYVHDQAILGDAAGERFADAVCGRQHDAAQLAPHDSSAHAGGSSVGMSLRAVSGEESPGHAGRAPIPGRPQARAAAIAFLIVAIASPGPSEARTVYRCVRDGTVSLATAPEPESVCAAHELDDDDPRPPNLWGRMGEFGGALYAGERDGRTVYSTRPIPGWRRVLAFTVHTPPGSSAHPGLGKVGRARMDLYRAEFRAAAKATGVEEAWLRAIAHAESYYDAAAVSEKGAQGVMQLMPDLVTELAVNDPFSARQSIEAGARHLRDLLRRYDGDLDRVAAAYNAGIGAVTLYGGIPPYAETTLYVAKVHALHARYRKAMGLPPPPGSERPAQ